MKIAIVPYQITWKAQFEQLRQELAQLLQDLHPAIEHIGSTSVENLSAKPIIDISVGVRSADDFDPVVALMCEQPDYLYYEVFNQSMPQRRLFVKIKGAAAQFGLNRTFTTLDEIPHEIINELRIAHIHVWVFGSEDWIRHLAFRDYIRAHEKVRKEYEQLKVSLSRQDWQHGMAYNDAKNDFIKRIEAEASRWYKRVI